MPVKSGKLKQRVTIKKRPADNLNNYGEEVDPVSLSNWTTVEAVYAEIEPMSSTELRIADSDSERVIYRIKMRYRDDLGTADTNMLAEYAIDWSGKWLDVRSVRNLGTNLKEFTTLICHEKVPA